MVRASEDRLSSLLDLVYDASTDPEGWPLLLDSLRKATASHVAVAYSKDPRRGGVDHLWVDGLGAEFFPQMPYYMPKDEWDRRRHLVPEASAVLGEAVISNRELSRKEVYADFLRPAGMARLCCAMGRNRLERVELVSLFRRECDAEFGADELRLMDALAPHLKRAFRIFERFSNVTEMLSADTLDLLSFGAFIIDATRKVRVVNKAGEALARRGDLLLRRGELRTALHADQIALEAAVAQALAPSATDARAALIAVQRPSGAPPLRVWIVPLPVRERSYATGPRHLAVLAVEPDKPVDALLHQMRSAFGFSPAEARLALALANGRTLEEHAAAQDVTLQTVRTQLQSIFNKSDTGRQPELVRLLMAALAPVAPPRPS
ncbi:MAG: putative Regulatory protein LuxR [Rhodospirillales bacterium]|nr:putative Regulatory protein LuxR [Rhodospirillales bacterium]